MDNNFNLLRVFAAIEVFFVHSWAHLYEHSASSISMQTFYFLPAVPIFFLVSGYLIPMSYENCSSLKGYFKNRALRILPALYVCFVISLFVLIYFGVFDSVGMKDIFAWVLAQLTFVQFYNPDFLRSFGVGVLNGSLWTISVELSFYLILPMMVWWIRKSHIVAFITLFSVAILFLAYFYYVLSIVPFSTFSVANKLFYVSILPWLFYFVFGVMFYFKRMQLIPIVRKYFTYILLAYITLYFFKDGGFIIYLLNKIVFSLLFFGLAFSFVKLSSLSYNKIDLTYGIYIYHMIVINVFISIGFTGDGIHVLIAFCITVFLAVLSFFLVEQPFLTLKSRSKLSC